MRKVVAVLIAVVISCSSVFAGTGFRIVDDSVKKRTTKEATVEVAEAKALQYIQFLTENGYLQEDGSEYTLESLKETTIGFQWNEYNEDRTKVRTFFWKFDNNKIYLIEDWHKR